MEVRYTRNIAGAFVISVGMLLLPTAICYYTLINFYDSSRWVTHTEQVLDRLTTFISQMKDAETGVRGYVATGNRVFLQPYVHAYTSTTSSFNEVRTLTRDNQVQQITLPNLHAEKELQFKILDTIYALKAMHQPVPEALLLQGKAHMDNARRIVALMQARENALLKQRATKQFKYLVYTSAAVVLITITALLIISWFYKRLVYYIRRAASMQHQLRQSYIGLHQRVTDIQHVTSLISHGDYNARLPEDEGTFKTLTASINKMSASLHQSFATLQELMHRKDEFIGIASHELKTPITSIKAVFQFLLRRNYIREDAAAGALITRANNQVNRLVQIINDLLDVSKINEQVMELNKSTFNLYEAISESATEVLMLDNNQHQFIYKGDQNIPVYADRFRIEQVLLNFLSNAQKYSPNADTIIAEVTRIEEHLLKVAITDFGIGIPAKKQNFVFDKYYRVHDSSKVFSGLGLGLYICNEIIKKHGGTVGMESTEGEGSTFWFTLPV